MEAREPADDLLSALLAAEDAGDRLTEQELIDQVFLLFIAGHETTVNLIGNGMLALLRNRAQMELLAATRRSTPTRSTSSCATTRRCRPRGASRSPTSRSATG